MDTALERIRIGAVIFGTTLVVATLGYRFLFGREWIDALYMVVITVTSVGYRDASADGQLPSNSEQLFTIAVITFGVTAGAYVMGGFLQLMTEGEIQRALGRRKMTAEISRLKNHVIVCGFGRIGQILGHDLHRLAIPFVIIESSAERIHEASASSYLVLNGDATEESLLEDAGICRAKSLVTSLPSDADNVFITLTARGINKKVQIIARAEHRSSEKKLLQAGANRVVLPATIGATQMAQIITRPTTADFLELISDRTKLNLEFDEVTIPDGGTLVGRTVNEAEAHRTHGLLVLAVKQDNGEMVFNPSSKFVFSAGDTLIVMGETKDINRFEEEYSLTR